MYIWLVILIIGLDTGSHYLFGKGKMKLIIIYGSEAVGKLTVSKELSQLISYPVFDNQYFNDLVLPFFEYGTEGFNDIIQKTRYLMFDEISKRQTAGMVFTWAYSHPDFQPQLDRIKDIVSRNNGTIYYVYLYCSDEELCRRVVAPDRTEKGKIDTIKQLERQRKRKNHAEIPGVGSLVIDNSDLSPKDTARIITRHFSLI